MSKMRAPDALSDGTVQFDEVTISCHVHEIPYFVEAELERLYEQIHASLVRWQTFRSLEHVNTCVARQGRQPVTLLLFKKSASTVACVQALWLIASGPVISAK